MNIKYIDAGTECRRWACLYLVSRVFLWECSVAAGRPVGLQHIYDVSDCIRGRLPRPFAKIAGRNSDRYLKRIKDFPLVVSCFGLRVLKTFKLKSTFSVMRYPQTPEKVFLPCSPSKRTYLCRRDIQHKPNKQTWLKCWAGSENLWNRFLFIFRSSFSSLTSLTVINCGHYKLYSLSHVLVSWENNKTLFKILYSGIMLRAQVWSVLYVAWSWHKTGPTPSKIVSNRICGIWRGNGEGANIRLDSRLLRFCNWIVLLWTILYCYRVT